MKLADMRDVPSPEYLSRNGVGIVLDCSQESVTRYEKAGFIARVPNVPRPVYRFDEIAEFAARLRLHAASLLARPELLLDETG